MTLHKYRSKKGTSRREDQSTAQLVSDPQSSNLNKSNEAARMAQSLASEQSWADVYAPQSPNTIMTPQTASANASELEGSTEYQHDESGPPPGYEESVGNTLSPSVSRDQRGLQPSKSHNVRSLLATRNSRSSYPIQEENRLPHEEDVHDEHEQLLPSSPVSNPPDTTLHDPFPRKQCKRGRRQRMRWIVAFVMVLYITFALLFLAYRKGAFQTHTPVSPETSKPPMTTTPGVSREYHRHETSQAITGTFTFYDVLDLSTTSGSINIILDPQPGDQRAVLKLSTLSGSIQVKLSDAYVAELHKQSKDNITLRPWDTTIKTSAGSVKIKLPVGAGSNTDLNVRSASINAKFYAANAGRSDPISTISTGSDSGSQCIEVQSLFGKAPITNLVASHHSRGSSSLKIYYPKVWEGELHASVGGSGNVKVQGSNLKLVNHGDKEVFASRGEGELLNVRCDGSGSIKVDCSG